MIKFTIITLFPEALEPYLSVSMMWKAVDKGLAEFEFVNLRDFGLGPHKSVDDTPYGGGDGMLLRCEPVFNAIEMVKAKDPSAKVILPTPVGETWNQGLAREFARAGDADALLGGVRSASNRRCSVEDDYGMAGGAAKGLSGAGDRRYSIEDCKLGQTALSVSEMEYFGQAPRSNENFALDPTSHYIILCPHYEGYDERILTLVDYKISLGKFVLTGGELPALVIIDSIVRLIPGVLGGETSAEIESFSDGDNLEYPQYTKPYDFRGMTVPDILLSGNHGEIAKWRAEHSGTAK